MGSILIRGGLVYSGENEPPIRADVLIEGERIARIGEIPAEVAADRTIDAAGLAVAPGFVDMHRHCDKGPLERKVSHPQGLGTVQKGNNPRKEDARQKGSAPDREGD